MTPKSRKSSGPRTPSAKRRAAAARHRGELIETTLALPPHRLAQAHLRAEEAAQFCAADPSLAAEARRFFLLREQHHWLALRIRALTGSFLTAPAPCDSLHPNLPPIDILLSARRRLQPQFDACLRHFLPAYHRWIQQAQAPPPASG